LRELLSGEGAGKRRGRWLGEEVARGHFTSLSNKVKSSFPYPISHFSLLGLAFKFGFVSSALIPPLTKSPLPCASRTPSGLFLLFVSSREPLPSTLLSFRPPSCPCSPRAPLGEAVDSALWPCSAAPCALSSCCCSSPPAALLLQLRQAPSQQLLHLLSGPALDAQQQLTPSSPLPPLPSRLAPPLSPLLLCSSSAFLAPKWWSGLMSAPSPR